tara:strand:+ start:1593 stop:2660 length:1068 start_codon:yes stop_codon:yes gene_type:complete
VACVRRGLQPVGSGWSFYLKRDAPSQIFYTRQFRGRKNEWWKSGTSIQEVADYYRLQYNKAFPSLPSISEITIGAWIWTGSHGSSGDTGAPSNACFKEIEYVALDKRIRVVPYALFDVKQALGIVRVSFDVEKMADNFTLHKRKIEYDALAVREWLRPSYQRAIFIGKHAVFLQWSKEKRVEVEEHEDPHCCSRFCLWLQSDPCNAACGCCIESEEKYASRVSLYEVNQFVPSVWRWTLPALFGYGHRNYEMFCALPKRVDLTEFFEKMVVNLLRMHEDIGGRSEIRFSKHVVFLDLSLTANFDKPFRVMESLGVLAYTLHKGKFEPSVASSMRKMSNKELYSYAKQVESKKIKF